MEELTKDEMKEELKFQKQFDNAERKIHQGEEEGIQNSPCV